MKRQLLYLMLMAIAGCSENGFPFNINAASNSQASTNGCPQEPTVKLTNVEKISLSNQPIKESGQVSTSKSLGYTFYADAGEKLNYQTTQDLCIWVYSPENELINGTDLPTTGNYVLQVGAPRGSTTFDLEMSLGTLQANVSPSNSSPSPNPRNSNSSSSSIPSATPQRADLTQDEAVQIVQGWYDAKPSIFAYPYDESLVEKYATGDLYYKTLLKPDEDSSSIGGVGWLRDRGCNWNYAFSNIEDVWLFSNRGERPFLKIRVHEGLELYGPNKGCKKSYNDYRANVTYWFAKDNGVWKIYDYNVED
ncbi:MAG: ARC6/PARC6 family protein [Halothece sp.]